MKSNISKFLATLAIGSLAMSNFNCCISGMETEEKAEENEEQRMEKIADDFREDLNKFIVDCNYDTGTIGMTCEILRILRVLSYSELKIDKEITCLGWFKHLANWFKESECFKEKECCVDDLFNSMLKDPAVVTFYYKIPRKSLIDLRNECGEKKYLKCVDFVFNKLIEKLNAVKNKSYIKEQNFIKSLLFSISEQATNLIFANIKLKRSEELFELNKNIENKDDKSKLLTEKKELLDKKRIEFYKIRIEMNRIEALIRDIEGIDTNEPHEDRLKLLTNDVETKKKSFDECCICYKKII